MAIRTKEEYEFETEQQRKGVHSDLAQLIRDLQLLQKRIEIDSDLNEGYFPQGSVLDLAVRYGKLCEMQRLRYAFQEVA